VRDYVHCMGQQRKKGKNVKMATSYCKSIMKRELDETDSLFDTRITHVVPPIRRFPPRKG
jgi:hypothetical protein